VAHRAITTAKNKERVFWIILSGIMLIRLFVGIKIPVYIIPDSAFDDYLMIGYASLNTHFQNYDMLSLVKTMSYPLFLAASHVLGLSYRFSLALIWIIAALVVLFAVRRFTKNRWFLAAVFTFVLFSPTAFDSDIGLRVYRNAILAPCTVITVGLMLHLVLGVLLKDRLRKNILVSIGLGFAFSFYYYIKEDSVYMMPLLIVVALVCLALWLYRAKKGPGFKQGFLKVFWVALIPLLIFVGCTNAYKAINNKYFGVYETNTRNEGAFGGFASRVLRVEDPEKTYALWVPYSTVLKVWNASPTLQAEPGLLEALLADTWDGDIQSGQVLADHFFWKLRLVLSAQGYYENEQKAEGFLSRVNADLDAAVANGGLKLFDDRIYLSSQAPGRTFDEILSLGPLVAEGVHAHLMYEGYSSTENNSFTEMTPEFVLQDKDPKIDQADFILNENLDKPDSFSIREFTFFLDMANRICQLYRLLAYPVIAVSVLGIAALFVRLVRRRAHPLDVLASCALFVCLGYALLVVFGIAWWGQWFTGAEKQYAVPAAAFFQLAEVFALLYGARLLKAWWLAIKSLLRGKPAKGRGDPVLLA